jgi:eukaryotic-like serine/threonine-protein kinase
MARYESARDDDDTIVDETEDATLVRDTEDTVVERREPVGPPPGAPDVEQAEIREYETIRPRPDGAIERDVVRQERRRRMTGDRAAWILLLLALLVAAGLGAWWYFTQQSTTVPTVEGLTVDRAVARLQDEDLKADIVTQPSDAQQGTVFDQDPAAGTEVDKDSSVRLLVSGGPETKTVPNAVGLPEAAARDRLVAAGLQVRTREVFSDKEPGTVVAQEPAAGEKTDEGGTVTINVSKGTGQVDVPDVVGLSRSEAEAEVESAKLEPNVVTVPSNEPEGTVVAQNPAGGTLRAGETVRLNVSAGPTTTSTDTSTDTSSTP